MINTIKDILREFSFVRFTWDGDEILMFTAGGESFSEMEFTVGSPTRLAFEKLYELVEDEDDLDISLDSPPA